MMVTAFASSTRVAPKRESDFMLSVVARDDISVI